MHLIPLAALLMLLPVLSFAIEPWVDPLPIPPRLEVKPHEREITVKMQEFRGKIHRDLPEAALWGFDGSSPGPTIEVEKGQQLTVHWVNELPQVHILPKPRNQMDEPGMPDVRAVVHLHGAAVEQSQISDRFHNNDGWPDLWLKAGETQTAVYPNQQDARTLWYHDHAMGVTGRNVAAGLLGIFLIHDDLERSLELPKDKFDIPLVLQPKKLRADGSIDYVETLSRENYGNAFFVNGALYPYLEVEPRKYRFRLINASNARTVALKLLDANDLESPGPAFYQIASDSGFLSRTERLNEPAKQESPRLILMPAERAEIIVDFSGLSGQEFILHNSQLPDDIDGVVPLYQIMKFRVGTKLSEPDGSKIPDFIRPVQRLNPEDALRTRRIVFEQMTMGSEQMLTLNGKMWRDPIDDFVELGSTEIWEIVNPLLDHHPFHLHLVDFQVLDRRPFDVKTFQKKGELHYTGEPQAPLPNELAWKDTVRATPGEVTRIIMRFGPFLGHYVYHCHILEHEDMDMMRPFDVVEPNRNTALGKVALARTGKPVQSSYTSLHSLGDGNSTLSMPGFFQLFSDPNRFSSPEKRGQKTCSIHGLRDRD